MKRWIKKQGFLLGVGVPGTFVWVIVAFLWPRIFGLEFLDYPNGLIVLNPGTGLGIGIFFSCYLWTFYRLVKWGEREHWPTMSSLGVIYFVSLLFYTYNPALFIQIWFGLLVILYVAVLISERHSKAPLKPGPDHIKLNERRDRS